MNQDPRERVRKGGSRGGRIGSSFKTLTFKGIYSFIFTLSVYYLRLGRFYLVLTRIPIYFASGTKIWEFSFIYFFIFSKKGFINCFNESYPGYTS